MATMVHSRGMAFYLAMLLLIATPFQGMTSVSAQQRPEFGVKELVLGTVVGAGALFGLKMMLGSASAVGSVGAAGTGFAGAAGRAMGAVMSGVSSLWSTISTGASSLFAGVGKLFTTGASGASTLFTQPWFLVSAALIGGGLLAYHFYNKSKSGSNSSRTIGQPIGFFDRMKNTLRAGMIWPGGMAPLRPAPYQPGYYNAMSKFYMGGPNSISTLGGFGARVSGPAPVATVLGDTARTGLTNAIDTRANLQPNAPAAPTDSASVSSALSKAEARKRAAYERLVAAMHEQNAAVSELASGAPPIDPVGDAIRDYKDATQQVESLREQLQAK